MDYSILAVGVFRARILIFLLDTIRIHFSDIHLVTGHRTPNPIFDSICHFPLNTMPYLPFGFDDVIDVAEIKMFFSFIFLSSKVTCFPT